MPAVGRRPGLRPQQVRRQSWLLPRDVPRRRPPERQACCTNARLRSASGPDVRAKAASTGHCASVPCGPDVMVKGNGQCWCGCPCPADQGCPLPPASAPLLKQRRPFPTANHPAIQVAFKLWPRPGLAPAGQDPLRSHRVRRRPGPVAGRGRGQVSNAEPGRPRLLVCCRRRTARPAAPRWAGGGSDRRTHTEPPSTENQGQDPIRRSSRLQSETPPTQLGPGPVPGRAKPPLPSPAPCLRSCGRPPALSGGGRLRR